MAKDREISEIKKEKFSKLNNLIQNRQDIGSEDEFHCILDINELTESKTCLHCKESFSKHVDFALHSVHHSDEFSCHLCKSETNDAQILKKHMETHEQLKCTVCDKHIRNRNSARKHSKLHLFEMELVKCRLCGLQLSRRDIKGHKIMKHQGSTPGSVKCSVCDKEYLSRSSLKRHYSSSHKEFGINTSKICDICGKVCSNTQKLQEHMRIHTGDKPFECALCPKKFMTKQVLKKHIRSHTGEKPLSCQFCGKKFKYDGGYRYHLKTHTGEKEHCCPICERAFISKSNMRVHMQGCGISGLK